MVKKLSVLLFFILGFELGGYAQVTIKIDESINQQLRIKNARIDSTKLSGYRIQIAFNSDRSKAMSAKSKFINRFPEYSSRAYDLYQQPYWKVRVGDLYRQVDAQSLLKEIRVSFPDAFVVRDFIRRPKL